MVEQMNITHKCEKLISGEPGFVVPSSYIVMIKVSFSMIEMVSQYNIILFCDSPVHKLICVKDM